MNIFVSIASLLVTFLAIRCSQSYADSAFVNLKPQAALLVIIGLLAQFRVLGGIGKQSFKLGIVGVGRCAGLTAVSKNLSSSIIDEKNTTMQIEKWSEIKRFQTT